MKTLLQNITRRQFALFIYAVLLVSLVYSKFALSVCMIALFVLGLINLNPDRKFPLELNPALRNNFKKFITYKPYGILSLYFFIVLIGGLYSDDGQYWLERLRLKIPFLLFPFAFASIPGISRRQYMGTFYFLLLLMATSAALVGIEYWQNFELTNKLMAQGQAMKTPMNHIRYSLLLALSILAGIYLITQKFYWKYRAERYFIGILTLGLFFFIHILSVRSGLIALYLSIIALSLSFVFRTRKVWIGVLTLGLLTALPLLAYQYIPSFNAKVRYAIYDLEMYAAGEEESYSDSERIISLQLGMKIGLENPLIGVGAGDLRREMEESYARSFPELTPKMPHNQLVSIFAGSGIIGLLAFCLAFCFPLFFQKNYRDPFLLSFHLVIFISFLMENTLETSIGIALYLAPLLLSLNFLSHQSE